MHAGSLRGIPMMTAFLLVMQLFLQHACRAGEATHEIRILDSTFYRNAGISRQPDTLLIILSRSEASRYLLVENPHINHIHFLQFGTKRSIITGDSLPFTQRPVPFRQFVFPVDAVSDIDSIRLVLDKNGENLSYGMHLLNREQLDAYINRDHLIIGFITGFYLLAILISVVMTSFSRRLKFMYFSLFVCVSMLWMLNDIGWMYQWSWPENPQWHNSSRGFFSSMTMALFGAYLYQNTGSHLVKRIRYAIYALAFLICLKIVIGLIALAGHLPPGMKGASMYVNATYVSALFGYIAIGLLWNLRKHPEDRFEILGIITYAFFICQLGLNELGLRRLHFDWLHQMGIILFFLLQILFISIHLFQLERKRREMEAEKILQMTIDQDRVLTEKLIEMEEQEKTRIAQNIHDEIGSLFVALKYHLLSMKQNASSVHRAEDLDQLTRICNHGIEKQYSVVDDMIYDQHTVKQMDEAIREKFSLIFEKQALDFEFTCGIDRVSLSDIQNIQLYRIVTELFTNTLKHAGAGKVWLEIRQGDSLWLSYRDDGRGFEPDSADTGRGLKNIRSRVSYLKGNCNFDRRSDGCRFTMEIPIRYE
jgi:signal transduction histidine kinase